MCYSDRKDSVVLKHFSFIPEGGMSSASFFSFLYLCCSADTPTLGIRVPISSWNMSCRVTACGSSRKRWWNFGYA